MPLIYFIIVPILSGVIAYSIPKIPLKSFVLIVELGLSIWCIYVFSCVYSNGVMKNVLGAEIEVLGISLIATRLTIILVALSILMFFLSFVYTMKEHFFDKKFVMLFFILQGLLCGVFLSDDLFNLYVLLEVATIVVSILIMFKKDSRSMYDGMVYLLSQIICMIFWLFGIGYMYKIFGVLSIEKIREMLPLVEPSALVLPFSFIMTAVCLKSAFFPLFSWLPCAHGTPSAPSAVSAILSGLYVKNGIYLFYVFTNLFSPAIDYTVFFTFIGAFTAILGFLFALVQTDIKLILAFHTVSQIGLISLGLTCNDLTAQYGAIYHLISHSLFKSLLFLSAGMIIKQYKTRDIRKIHGVFKTMPLTGFCTILGILAITGAPFFNASISKYFMQYGAKGSVTEVLIFIVNAGTILSFTKYSSMLWGKKEAKVKSSYLKEAVLLVLGILCILGGIFGVDFINLTFGSELSITSRLYVEKTITYFIMIISAHLFYKYILSKSTSIYKLRKISLNFQQIIIAMVFFFIVVSVASANFIIS